MSRIRLICPNCGAQYDVPAEVIPPDGRDVQCSNCAHTWFQKHPDDTEDRAEDPLAPPPSPPDAQDDLPPEASEEDDWSEPEVAPAAPKRGLDPEVAEVLRAEAEHERRQREAEAIETQTELGLDEPFQDAQERRSREARARMAAMRGETEPQGDAEDAEPGETAPDTPQSAAARSGRAAARAATAAAESRKELLPDVDEINQTLRAGNEPRVTDSAEGRVGVDDLDAGSAQGKGGFARGFFLVVVLVAIAIAVYASAPQIEEALPQAAPLLDAYVAQVDVLRAWLDEVVGNLFQTLDGLSSEATGPDNS